MSFRQWIEIQYEKKQLKGALADFIDDAHFDKEFPEVFTWKELKKYLDFCDAIPAAEEAAKKCFKKWQQASKSKKPPKEKVDGLNEDTIKRIRWQFVKFGIGPIRKGFVYSAAL